MVVGLHDPQHSQAVSPVQLMHRHQRASRSGTSPTPDAAIAEDGKRRGERAARGRVTITAITRTDS
jgi:hypothetical protein